LRVTDRVAVTAARTLKEQMGYGAILASLERRTYFRFAAAGDPEEAAAYIRDLAANTAAVANPNKETYTLDLLQRPLGDVGKRVALVYPRAGLFDEDFLKRVVWELGYDRVVAAGKGVAWTIGLAPGVDASYAEEILVARSRGKGLLLNPHAEKFEWA